MKAAVLSAAKTPLVIEDVRVDAPRAHEVLIRTVACGVCRSDLHFVDGAYPHAMPCIPGHEAAGIVEAIGSEVRTVRVGDAVVTCLSAFCGQCEFCVTGRMSLCLGADTRRGKDEPPRLTREADGSVVNQMLNLSAYAEMMLVHEHACVRIDPDMPLDRAAILGCAVVTGAGAVFHAADVTPGDTVCIVGCGGVGLAAVNAAKIAGAGRIIACDPVAEKRELAMKLGATDAVDASAEDAGKQVVDLTKGGVDHAIEAVGRPASGDLAVASLKRGGTATILGMMPLGHKVGLGALDLLGGKKLQGALMGANRFPVDIPRLVDFYLRGHLDLDQAELQMNAEQDFIGTVEPTGQDILDTAKLTDWMTANVAGFTGPVTVRKFAGGQSNPTYRLDSPSGSYVLRRKPFGPLLPSAHAVDREFAVIAGLHPTGFPVAKPYGLCTDENLLGSWFYIMSMVEGRTIWDGTLPGLTPAQRTDTYNAMIDTLAALHNVDHVAAGLGEFGKAGNYFERQVGRWTKQYRAAETETMPDMDALIDYLARTIPPQTRTTIVHGDYRIDNMIFAATEPKVIAVLDWELSTTGDPLADFSYLMMNWLTPADDRAGLAGLDLPALGIPTLDQAVARYCAATGRDGVPRLEWYFAFGLFRLASIVQGIKKRVIDGTASSAHAAQMAERVPYLAERAWNFAKEAGA